MPNILFEHHAQFDNTNNRDKYLSLIVFLSFFILSGCTTQKEVGMPFRNFSYAAERLFPVKENNTDFTFRASINFSTNIDRIITISKDSLFGEQGNMIELITSERNRKGQVNTTYHQKKIMPKDGIGNFIAKVDSLNLLDYKNQKDFEITLDQPFSLYVIEVKCKGRYNQFRFKTNMSDTSTQDIYLKIQRFILYQFNFKSRVK